MKKFFKMFADSAKEFGSVKSITVTGMFIAVSMVIESLSIDIGYTKINFAFLAIAVIGMLFGPVVGFGGACGITFDDGGGTPREHGDDDQDHGDEQDPDPGGCDFQIVIELFGR